VSCGCTAFLASTPRLALAVSSKSSLQVSPIDMIIGVKSSFVTATEFPCFGIWASFKLLDGKVGITLDMTRPSNDGLMNHDSGSDFWTSKLNLHLMKGA
jgi:hypothetical protein